MFGFSIGAGPLTLVVVNEMLPLHLRGRVRTAVRPPTCCVIAVLIACEVMVPVVLSYFPCHSRGESVATHTLDVRIADTVPYVVIIFLLHVGCGSIGGRESSDCGHRGINVFVVGTCRWCLRRLLSLWWSWCDHYGMVQVNDT